MIPSRTGIPPLLWLLLFCLLGKIDAVVHRSASRSFLKSYNRLDPLFTIHTVSLTQKGYLQFLRYPTEVPTLTDYTFCIWVKSNNLTYNHPLLSYSKHEEERLIRVWISPRGKTLNLEILNHAIASAPVHLIENHWYHICQSWASSQGAWSMYLNGKIVSTGFVPKLRGVPIEGGGDIVVGQEYTDFDKGLDDGIEGDVFGFNFVLASTSRKQPPGPSRGGHVPRSHLNGKRFIVLDKGDDFRNINVLYLSGLHRRAKDYGGVALLRRAPLYAPGPRRILTGDASSHRQTSLGSLLVALSFDCAVKKGAPLAGSGVLINWTKTPVRVFGGAVLRDVPPFCRKIDLTA